MRKFIKLFATALVATVIIIACQKEISNSKKDNVFDDKSVKEWYYGTFKKSPEWAEYNSSLKGRKLPDWKNGTYKKLGDMEMVEFPLVKEKNTVPILQKTNLQESEKRKIVNAAISRAVFIKQKTGNVIVREMQYIPDIDYLARHNFDISQNTIGNTDKDFSGIIIIKKWNGQDVSKNILKNGKIISKIKIQDNYSQIGGGLTESCPVGNTEIIEWARDDVIHIYGDGMITYQYGEWYQTGNQWCVGDEDIDENPACDDPNNPDCFCALIGGCDGSNGQDPPPCNQTAVDNAINSVSTTSLNTKDEIETTSESPTSITRNYKWKFARVEAGLGSGITFYSHETGLQDKGADGWWRWTSFVHNSESQSGGAIFWGAEINSLTPTASMTNIEIGGPLNTTVSIAGMQLNWGLKVTYSCGILTGETYPTGTSSQSWYTHEQ
jgi:hypothetical protein